MQGDFLLNLIQSSGVKHSYYIMTSAPTILTIYNFVLYLEGHVITIRENNRSIKTIAVREMIKMCEYSLWKKIQNYWTSYK